MNAFDWVVVISTVGTIVFAWAFFVTQTLRLRDEKTNLDEEEERLLELMGKVRIFVDSKIEALDRKLEEVREVIRELNEKYVEFSALLVSDRLIHGKNSVSTERERKVGEPLESGESAGVAFHVERPPSGATGEYSAALSSDRQKVADGGRARTSVRENGGVAGDSIEEKIMKLYDDGLEPIEIAKTLNIGVGEVNLVLDLYRRHGPMGGDI